MTASIRYHVAMVSDVVMALMFLALGLHAAVGRRTVAGGVALLGFLVFGLLEYAAHRWVLHGPPSIAMRGHAEHHARPAALIATPPLVVIAVSLALWAMLRLVCADGVAALAVFGLYAGYNYFALFHHWEHHHRGDGTLGPYWRELDRAHHLHHRRQSVNFGVSTTVWDRVFGTFLADRPR